MEERIIDDEYGRGVRMKKTKDGYVDVTDAEVDEAEANEEEVEEALFEFPMFETDEDDEELATLTPEEAMELKKRREEEAAQRKADYERLCAEGEEQLQAGSYKTAELKFEKALPLDQVATEASVGYWRAKTADFTNPDVLVAEYAESSIESLEFDVGYEATDIIRERYQNVFKRRLEELAKEEAPLVEAFESKQQKRRAVLKTRLRRSGLWTVLTALPTIAALVLAIVFGLKITSVKENTYILPSIICAAVFLVLFIAFLLVTNKWINDLRMRRANERLSASEEGLKLMQIRDYKAIYEALLPFDGGKKAGKDE